MGRGVVDFAKENFQNHSADQWNQQIDSLLQQDISVIGRQRQKRLSLDHQRKVIELFNNLFASGFHLGEIVDFLRRSQLLADRYTQVLSDGLLAGKPFSSLLADLRFRMLLSLRFLLQKFMVILV